MQANDSACATAACATTTQPAGAERRRYPRLVFAPGDGVTAGLSFAVPDGTTLNIQAMVMNLSQGGLGMGIPRDEMGGLTLVEKALFHVAELRIAYRSVSLPLATAAQIRWFIDADYLDHVCFGCAFQHRDDRLVTQLRDFIDANFPHLALA